VGKKRKETNQYECKEWKVGNFLTQKQVKAVSEVLSSLYLAKAAFGCGFERQPSPLVGFWLCQKQKQLKAPTKGTLNLVGAFQIHAATWSPDYLGRIQESL
jgi:hypothetical protein